MATRKQAAEELRRSREFFARVQKEGAWAPVFLLTGTERFILDEALRRIIASVFPEGRDDFNLIQLQAHETTADDIVDAARMAPMFASRRVVVVRGLERMPAAQLERIAAYADAPVDSTVLVLEASALDGRAKGTQRLMKAGAVAAVKFVELEGDDLLRWVTVRARDRRLVLDRDVPAWLVEALGSSLATLQAALERIDLYLPESVEGVPREVTTALCESVITDVRHRDVFELVDALGARDVERAFVCYRSLLEQGEESIRSLGMIAMQFRRLLVVHELARLPDSAVAPRAQIPEFRVRDYRRLAQRFSHDELRAIMHEILRTDHALKSSRLRDVLIVERLLLRICTAERSPTPRARA